MGAGRSWPDHRSRCGASGQGDGQMETLVASETKAKLASSLTSRSSGKAGNRSRIAPGCAGRASVRRLRRIPDDSAGTRMPRQWTSTIRMTLMASFRCLVLGPLTGQDSLHAAGRAHVHLHRTLTVWTKPSHCDLQSCPEPACRWVVPCRASARSGQVKPVPPSR